MAKVKSGFENFLSSVGRVISYPFRLIGSAFKAFINWILPNTFKDKEVEPGEQEASVTPVTPEPANPAIAQDSGASLSRTPKPRQSPVSDFSGPIQH